MDWTLERVNVPNDFIVLNKNLSSYPCGRSIKNFLVCPSGVVSRRHCIFVRVEDGISVIDLKSSNGVYIDGKLSEAQVLVELKEGNVIGIGSSELVRDNELMFAYKLHRGNLELLTQKSTTVDGQGTELQPSKRILPQDKDEEPHLPPKIFKVKNKLEERQKDAAEPSNSHNDEIQEVWSNVSRQIAVQTEEKEIVVESSIRSNRTKLNVSEVEEESKTVDLTDREMEMTPPRRSKSSEAKDEKPSTDIDSPVSPRAPVVDSSHKTIHLSITTPSATTLTFDFTESNLRHSSATTRGKKRDRDHAPKADKERSKKRETKKKKTKKKDEDVETRTKKDVVKGKKKKDVVEGKKCDLNSLMEKKPESRLSFKIKQVNQEPITSYTLFDIVDLSDDDDYVFPSSQLFDTNVEDKSAKQETDGSSNLQENGSDEDDKDMFAGSDAMIKEFQEMITLSDSEDEDNPWLRRLSLSQRLKEEALKIPKSLASPGMEFVAEVIKPVWIAPSEPPEPEPPKELPKKPSPVRDCSVEVLKLPYNMTAKRQQEDRIKPKTCAAEQKKIRTKNVELPSGKRRSFPLSKSQKLEIANERKKKLKQLAEKQKADSVKQLPVDGVAAEPEAKVSDKNRGDFSIAEDLRMEQVKNRVIPDPAEPSNSKIGEEKSSSKRNEEKEKASRSSSRSPSRDKNRRFASKHKSSSKHHRREKSVEKRSDKLSKSLKKVAIASPKVVKALPAIQKKNREGKEGKKKKRVRFSENLVKVRKFDILPNNKMKKCVGKDALIPSDKIRRNKKVDVDQHPRILGFLMDIFKWNPSWLEAQNRLKTDPPVVEENSLIPLKTKYKSYEVYYQTLRPLLLLELWHGLTKEFEGINENNRRQVMLCSIMNNSVTTQPIPSTDMHLTKMMLEALATEEDVRLQRHPINGDLIFLELQYRDEGANLKVLKVFAYVTQLDLTTITQDTSFNRDLMCTTPNATKVLAYSILTKPLQVKLCMNRVIRMRCVMYLRAEMRMLRALQWLPNSPLADLILNPEVELYHLALPPKDRRSDLVTGDKLNHIQVDAVFKVTEAVVNNKEPKLCLVQGPPGTGKSEVVVNMVMQILYGDYRYRNDESNFRILLCAPSNAAIDEIVLRLLDRREKLTRDRFRMVRVGHVGSMHPRVKDASVEELARRHVDRTIAGYQSGDDLQEQMRMWEAKINKLTLELNCTYEKDEKKRQFKSVMLSAARVKYDLIKKCTQSATSAIDPREMTKLQKAAESQFLMGADIIACTLSSCDTNILESAFGNTLSKISVCIIDEATQSCEAETLIPLMLGVNTLVLVGDPAQLPTSIISQRAKNLGLEQSLFSRMQRAFESHDKSPVMRLDLQYRMNADILAWPKKFFYNERLRNGLVEVKPLLPLQPYRVMDLDSCQDDDKFFNTREAEFVANLTLGLLRHLESKRIAQISIGVITPYRNQRAIVQAKINERIGRLSPVLENLKIVVNMAIDTVDGFQGQERDVIIMSCGRSSGVGFLADRQQLCVALTRAKHCLVLCGNFGTFQTNLMWGKLLADAKSRKNYLEMKYDATPGDIASLLTVK